MQPYRPQRNAADSTSPQGSGPYAPCWVPGQDLVYPGCGQPVKAVCDMDQVGARLASTAPQAVATLQPGPQRQEFFQVLAARMVVSDSGDPQTNSRVFISNWTVNQQPVKGYSVQLALANTSGIWSDQYIAPDGYGIPEPGYIISQPNLVNRLEIGFANLEPATGGLTLDTAISLWGNGLAMCPAGWNMRCKVA